MCKPAPTPPATPGKQQKLPTCQPISLGIYVFKISLSDCMQAWIYRSLCLRPRFQRTLGSRFTCAKQETDGHASAPGIHLDFFAIYFLVLSLNRFRSFFASLCFQSLDSAPVLPWAPPPDKHVTGVGFPMASRAPKLVVRPRYLEPFCRASGTYMVHGPGRRGRCRWQLGTAVLACHSARPL
jgi:hypothetical protein